MACSSAVFSQESTRGNKILVLFDSNALTPFKQRFGDGLEGYISELQADGSNIRISYEFLGLENLSAGDFPDILSDMLAYKQRADPASVIVSALSTTNSLSTLASELYPGLPVIYASPNPELETVLQAQNLQHAIAVIGSAGDAIRGTVAVIPQLLPELEHLYVISGNGGTELDFREVASNALDELNADFEVNYLTGLPIGTLLQAVVEIPEHSSILLLPVQLDNNGTMVQVGDVYSQVVASAGVPVFTAFDFIYQEGVVGGNFANSEASGRRVAEVAVAVLLDQNIDDGARVLTSFRFDQRQLQRWGISNRLLPPESIIDNQQISSLEQYSRQILVVLIIFAGLLFFVVFFKRQAKSLETQKTLFESVINSIPDAILIADVDTRIFACNTGAEKVLGFSQEELLGRHTQLLLDYSDDKNSRALEANSLMGSVEPQLLSYKKKNGEIFFGETIATRITSDSGEILGQFALIRDVSKRLSLEEEHRQGQKMEALGNLVGGISHDFNNVLGVISGYTELSLTSKASKPFAQSLQQILKATDRARSLVAQIMTFSRDRNPEQKPINMPELLDETMKLVQVSIPSSVEIIVKCDDEIQTVMGSAIQLQQIIINLTTNAYQSMKSSGGCITVALERREFSEEKNLSQGVLSPGCYCVLSIADNGPGMSEEVASRAFEPYFTTKNQGEGSGMGLAIVYNLVKAHGAMLDLKTVPDEGTCITVYLKEGVELDVDPNADTEAMVRGNGERILLVDDEESLLNITQRLLSGNGYQVTAFSHSIDALEAFKRNPQGFDLILTDQSMPKLTGTQLLEHVRLLNSTIPAIICTGYSDLIEQENIDYLKLSAVLKKPFRLREISKIIADALVVRG
ncbi:MAG: PAS domain S-box protein [Pseudohongiella sp.]|nr:PAS domain S-box protein [Pseudohongiella sp.]